MTVLAYIGIGTLILIGYLALQEITDRFDGRGKK